MVGMNELTYFADVCSGPGGFSEYVFFRKAWRAKGFGFTLKGENDFKLSEFIAGTCESFEPYYGMYDIGIFLVFILLFISDVWVSGFFSYRYQSLKNDYLISEIVPAVLRSTRLCVFLRKYNKN